MSLVDAIRNPDTRLEIELLALADRQAAKLELAAMRLDPPPWHRRAVHVDLASVPHRQWPLNVQAAYHGQEPAEALPQSQRHALVKVLNREGLDDVDIAERLRMSLYTTARIRQALRLAPNVDYVPAVSA